MTRRWEVRRGKLRVTTCSTFAAAYLMCSFADGEHLWDSASFVHLDKEMADALHRLGGPEDERA